MDELALTKKALEEALELINALNIIIAEQDKTLKQFDETLQGFHQMLMRLLDEKHARTQPEA